jgi:glycosyltransferase involved in cell wall biosynthesis
MTQRPPNVHTDPIRVAFYTDAASIGGAERIAGAIIAGLAASFEVVVAGHATEVVEWLSSRRPGAAAVPLGPRPTKRSGSVARLRRQLRGLGCDVLHVNRTYLGSCLPALVAAATLSMAVVVVDHSTAEPDNEVARRLAGRLSRRAAGRVAVGPRAAAKIERALRLPPASTRIIPNGVPVPGAAPFDWPAETVARAVRVGTVARLDPGKGIDLLLRAVAAIPGVEGVVIGDGEERVALERLAHSLGIAPRVTFTGWCADPRDELDRLDVFVLASREEALPLGVLEAMAAGLPVVATDVGDVAHAVDHGRTGALIPRDDLAALVDALTELVADPALRAAQGAAGHAVARARFTERAMVAAYADLYRAVVPRRGQGGWRARLVLTARGRQRLGPPGR